MTAQDISIVVGSAITFLTITVLGKRFGWYELIGGTNKLLKEQNTELRNQNELLKDKLEEATQKHIEDAKEWNQKHEENIKALSTMQGQIDVLKSIPLVNIDSTLQKIADANSSLAKSNIQIKNTNKKILDRLEGTAEIAAEDRDVLTNQNKHIRTEVDKVLKGKKKPKK
jgi:hypothetical protein